MCFQRARDSRVLPFGGAVNFLQGTTGTGTGEPGFIESPAAAAAVIWPPPGPAPAQEPGLAGLPTAPAPAQQAQGGMYNAGHNGSRFIDEGAQEGREGVKRRGASQHCLDCGHVKQKGPFSRYHVPSLLRALQSPSNIGAGGAGGEGVGCRRGHMFLLRGSSAQSTEVASQGQRKVWRRVQL